MSGEWRAAYGSRWEVDRMAGNCQVTIRKQVIFGSHPDFGKADVDHYETYGPFDLTREDIDTLSQMMRACSEEKSR